MSFSFLKHYYTFFSKPLPKCIVRWNSISTTIGGERVPIQRHWVRPQPSHSERGPGPTDSQPHKMGSFRLRRKVAGQSETSFWVFTFNLAIFKRSAFCSVFFVLCKWSILYLGTHARALSLSLSLSRGKVTLDGGQAGRQVRLKFLQCAAATRRL